MALRNSVRASDFIDANSARAKILLGIGELGEKVLAFWDFCGKIIQYGCCRAILCDERFCA